jgi:hypothetical protein
MGNDETGMVFRKHRRSSPELTVLINMRQILEENVGTHQDAHTYDGFEAYLSCTYEGTASYLFRGASCNLSHMWTFPIPMGFLQWGC